MGMNISEMSVKFAIKSRKRETMVSKGREDKI